MEPQIIYETPNWIVYAIDAVIIMTAIVGLAFTILFKKNKYQKEAEKFIRVEIELPTGHTEYHTVECDKNAKTISISSKNEAGELEDFVYFLHPQRTRWGRHPRIPFMGLSWMQVPIRVERFYKDNPNPVQEPIPPESEDENTRYFVTSSEMKATTRQMQATMIGMEIQETEARQSELTHAIGNQPNKNIVYISLGVTIAILFAVLIIVAQIGGVI